MPDWTQVITGFLGGGLVAGLLGWYQAISTERINRRIEFLSKQLSHLYGPLYFFVGQNKSIFEFTGSIDSAYKTQYCEPKWSDNEITRKSVSEQANQAIQVKNRYVEVITNNNDEMARIIRENYSLIDPQDNHLFQTFVLDQLRLRTEKSSANSSLPRRIEMVLANIAFLRHDFVQAIEARFSAKTSELAKWRERYSVIRNAIAYIEATEFQKAPEWMKKNDAPDPPRTDVGDPSIQS